jgi:hypothetical protein
MRPIVLQLNSSIERDRPRTVVSQIKMKNGGVYSIRRTLYPTLIFLLLLFYRTRKLN